MKRGLELFFRELRLMAALNHRYAVRSSNLDGIQAVDYILHSSAVELLLLGQTVGRHECFISSPEQVWAAI